MIGATDKICTEKSTDLLQPSTAGNGFNRLIRYPVTSLSTASADHTLSSLRVWIFREGFHLKNTCFIYTFVDTVRAFQPVYLGENKIRDSFDRCFQEMTGHGVVRGPPLHPQSPRHCAQTRYLAAVQDSNLPSCTGSSGRDVLSHFSCLFLVRFSCCFRYDGALVNEHFFL